MKKLKRLIACLCVAVIGVATLAMQVSAEEYDSGFFNDVRDTYKSPSVELKYKLEDRQLRDLYENARITDSNQWYMDDYIKYYANLYKDDYYVGDLRILNEYDQDGVYADYDHNIFNYGIVVMDDYSKPTFRLFVCKCSQKDFETWMDFLFEGRVDKQKAKTLYSFSHFDRFGKNVVNYDPRTNVLRIKEIVGVFK